MEDNYEFEKDLLPKKRKNSKIKGNSFERKLCKLLNEHFQTKEFMRTPGSGAFATTHKLPDRYKIHGDLMTPEGFIYSIECKKGYNDIQISDIFDKKSKLWFFIRQAKSDANKSNKKWMVIWQQDRKHIMCITDKCDTTNILEKERLTFDEISITLLESYLYAYNKSSFYSN